MVVGIKKRRKVAMIEEVAVAIEIFREEVQVLEEDEVAVLREGVGTGHFPEIDFITIVVVGIVL